jgi:hypothetical protein
MALANITNNILTDSGILVTNLTPTSRTLTINNTTYDLSADRSWTIATGVGGSGTTNYLPKFTGASTIGNSLVQDNGSTVSISTNSTVLSLDRTGAGTALIELKTNGTVRSYFGADASVPFIFFTQSASELMRLNASGNLSIGNTNNTYKLDVSGDGTFSGFVNANVYNLAGLTGGGALSWTTNTLRLGQDSYFQNLQFWTNGSIKMRLDASGNLGLGVTPSAWFSGNNSKAIEVSGAGNAFWAYGSTSNINTYITNNAYYDSVGFKYGQSGGGASAYRQNDGVHQWFIAPSGTAGNAISFTQAMTLNASGNLSIGNTNDTYKLDVSGTGRFTGVVTSDSNFRANQGVYQQWRAGGFRGGLYTYDGASGSGTDYSPTLFSETELYFCTGGSVTKKLTIASTGAATFSSSVTANSLIATGLQNNIYSYNTDISNGQPGLVVANNSTIATSTNTSYFKTYNYNATTLFGQSVTDYLFIGTEGAANNGILFGTVNSRPVIFGTNNAERMRITSGGSVLIGTTTEGFLGKLQVAGSVAITGQYNTVLPSSSFAYFDGSGQVVSSSSNASALYLDTTWNTTGNPDGIYLNVTNTASGASSKLLNLKVGSVSQFSVSKGGAIQTSDPTNGTARPWKLGDARSGGISTDSYIIVEVNGVTYSIPALNGLP